MFRSRRALVRGVARGSSGYAESRPPRTLSARTPPPGASRAPRPNYTIASRRRRGRPAIIDVSDGVAAAPSNALDAAVDAFCSTSETRACRSSARFACKTAREASRPRRARAPPSARVGRARVARTAAARPVNHPFGGRGRGVESIQYVVLRQPSAVCGTSGDRAEPSKQSRTRLDVQKSRTRAPQAKVNFCNYGASAVPLTAASARAGRPPLFAATAVPRGGLTRVAARMAAF